jgi:DNA invertase Pin-like site-specific DNA recombinase
MEQSFVAYYRVSTTKQGVSGLGLDAQRAAVAAFLHDRPLLAEFTEVESGKKNDRPQLAAALALCKRKKTTLLIAKIDRLARNVAFIANLMEGKVEFVACDMPQASRFTIHILAAVAEHEAKIISERTKAGLAQAKLRGVKLGNPRSNEALLKAQESKRKVPDDVKLLISESHGAGLTLQQIADKLNGLGIKTPQNKTWWAQSIKNQL